MKEVLNYKSFIKGALVEKTSEQKTQQCMNVHFVQVTCKTTSRLVDNTGNGW